MTLMTEALFKFVFFRASLKKIQVYKWSVMLIYGVCFFEFALIGVIKLARMRIITNTAFQEEIIGFKYDDLVFSILRFAVASFLSMFINVKTFQKKYLGNKKVKEIKQRMVSINKSYFKNEVKIMTLLKSYVRKELLLEDINNTVIAGK